MNGVGRSCFPFFSKEKRKTINVLPKRKIKHAVSRVLKNRKEAKQRRQYPLKYMIATHYNHISIISFFLNTLSNVLVKFSFRAPCFTATGLNQLI